MTSCADLIVDLTMRQSELAARVRELHEQGADPADHLPLRQALSVVAPALEQANELYRSTHPEQFPAA